MLGYEKAELARARWADLTHPEDLEKSQGFLDRVLSGDEPSARFVKRYFRKDGSVLWGEVRTAIRRDASGRPLYFMTNVLDVSERKKAEEMLRASEEKYRRIVDTAHDGIWTIDAESRTTFVNRRMAEVLGYSPEEMLGRPVFDFMTDEAAAIAVRNVERRKKGIAEEHDFCYQRKDGSAVWTIMGTTPLFAPDGAYAGAQATVTDITERRKVEAALRESTERNGTILKTAMDGFWLADPLGRLLEVNEAYCRMSGYSEHELLSMSIADLEAVENPEETAVHIHTVQSQGSDRFESRHRRKDGAVFDVEISVQQGPIEGGLMVAFLRDVSERKRLEEERRSLQEDLTATVEALPDLMFDVDREGRIFDFRAPNPGLLFAKPDDFLGKLVQEVLPPRAARVACDAITDAVRTGSHMGSGFPLAMPDGERWFELSIAAKGGPDGGRERFVVLSRDITERKRGEELLRENERRYRIVAENTSAWEFWVDPQGRYIYCSPSCELLTGHRPEEFIANPGLLRTLVHPDDRDALVAHKRARLEKGATGLRRDRDAMAFRVLRPDGTTCWVEHVCSIVVDEEGRFLGVRGSNRDVTSRRKAEDELQRLNADLEGRVVARTEELEAANQELESFSYSVSHDLRAPLRAIEGFSAMVLKSYGASLDAEGQRLLGVVRKSARRMSQLIDDLLDFSRKNRTEIHRNRLRMKALALSAFEEVIPDPAARARIDFRLGDLPDADGDTSLLAQVWLNLLSNAVKFSANAEHPAVEVSGSVEGDFAVFRVRDNGAGFDMAYADKLFGVFQRLHGASEFEGTGIGLALVKRIVERHRGLVWAESEVGKGATFSFSLPAKPRSDSGTSWKAVESSPTAR